MTAMKENVATRMAAHDRMKKICAPSIIKEERSRQSVGLLLKMQ